MPAPVSSQGTIGNALPRTPVAPGKNAAGLLDLTTGGLGGQSDIEGRLTCKFVVGAVTAPILPITYSAYLVYGPATTITTFNSSTSIVVASAADIDVGQTILLQQAGGSKNGELAKVTGVSGTTLTVNTLEYTYVASDNVYLINQTPSFNVSPASSAGTWATSTVYSAPMYLPTGRWAIAAANTDASATVTVVGTSDFVTGYQ